MNPQTVFSYHILPQVEQRRIAALWPDGLDPAGFIYSLDTGGNVTGRQSITGSVEPTPLPLPVSSSTKTHKLTNLQQAQQIARQVTAPSPGQRRGSSTTARDLITLIVWGVLAARGER